MMKDYIPTDTYLMFSNRKFLSKLLIKKHNHNYVWEMLISVLRYCLRIRLKKVFIAKEKKLIF